MLAGAGHWAHCGREAAVTGLASVQHWLDYNIDPLTIYETMVLVNFHLRRVFRIVVGIDRVGWAHRSDLINCIKITILVILKLVLQLV